MSVIDQLDDISNPAKMELVRFLEPFFIQKPGVGSSLFVEDVGTGAGGGGAVPDVYASTPAMFPLMLATHGPSYSGGISYTRAEPVSRTGGVRTNYSTAPAHTPAVNDSCTFKVTLGPKGSIWGFTATWLRRPDGGQFTWGLASHPSPNPGRGGTNDQGTLEGITAGGLTFVEPSTSGATTYDTYDTSVYDDYLNGFWAFRIMGNVGDTLTAFTNNADTFTGYATMNGGPGVYTVRIRVTGKNASSSGYRCELTGGAFLRIDDDGEL